MSKELIIKFNLITDQKLSSQTLCHLSKLYKVYMFFFCISFWLLFLKLSRQLSCCRSGGLRFQTSGPTFTILFLPWYPLCTEGILKSICCRKLYWDCFDRQKILEVISGTKSFLNSVHLNRICLNIFVVNQNWAIFL